MNRLTLTCVLLFLSTAALGAQEASQSTPYQGTSTPPSDSTIQTTGTPQAKPLAGRSAALLQAQSQSQAQPAPADVVVDPLDPDSGIVTVQQNTPAPQQPALTQRSYAADPDGDIVHPQPPQPGELPEGTAIRVRLLTRLSSESSARGDQFRCRVASDVMQDDHVLIPAGAELRGRVTDASSGHFGGHGSLRLLPETMILPSGAHYRLHAELIGAPGSRTRVASEDTVLPGSREKRDAIEYGGTVGAGVTAGAILGGPAGALAGALVGAGVITTHLLVSHPQATLDPGTVLLFTLSEPLQMTPAGRTESSYAPPTGSAQYSAR
jgi:hypothetical protein